MIIGIDQCYLSELSVRCVFNRPRAPADDDQFLARHLLSLGELTVFAEDTATHTHTARERKTFCLCVGLSAINCGNENARMDIGLF